MKNTSGGSLATGDVVVFKTGVAGANEITTTTTQGDDMVFGVLGYTTSNNAKRAVQTLGRTSILKVDGTTDIAIGDFIGTSTTAGVQLGLS